jgi:uncharacterized protein YwgA
MSDAQNGDRLVAEVVAVGGGRIVGRVRLQKLFYLLDRMGLESGFRYEYHHYGPYSAELAASVEDATVFGLISERLERRAYDGVPYSIFERPSVSVGPRLGSLERPQAGRALARMQEETATVLELAATIDWLRVVEQIPDWQRELVRRKRGKAQPDRVERADALLGDLRLT